VGKDLFTVDLLEKAIPNEEDERPNGCELSGPAKLLSP
jgi:hypothetical protein